MPGLGLLEVEGEEAELDEIGLWPGEEEWICETRTGLGG